MESIVTLIKARRDQLKTIRAELKELTAKAKAERIAKVETRKAEISQRRQIAAAKKAERIAKLEARLQDLKSPAVGTKARKAARKPGPVTITKG
jgi:hypothetical protein